jgi:ribosomal protein S8
MSSIQHCLHPIRVFLQYIGFPIAAPNKLEPNESVRSAVVREVKNDLESLTETHNRLIKQLEIDIKRYNNEIKQILRACQGNLKHATHTQKAELVQILGRRRDCIESAQTVRAKEQNTFHVAHKVKMRVHLEDTSKVTEKVLKKLQNSGFINNISKIEKKLDKQEDQLENIQEAINLHREYDANQLNYSNSQFVDSNTLDQFTEELEELQNEVLEEIDKQYSGSLLSLPFANKQTRIKSRSETRLLHPVTSLADPEYVENTTTDTTVQQQSEEESKAWELEDVENEEENIGEEEFIRNQHMQNILRKAVQ